MKKISVHHHLGLGDHFICNGLVRTLAETCDFLYLAVKKQNFVTVSNMYSDDSRIVCVEVEDDNIYNLKQLKNIDKFYRIGFENTTKNYWDKSFYDCVGIPFHHRFSKCKYNRNLSRENNLEKLIGINNSYILIHNTSSSGSFNLNINNSKKIIKITNITDNLLDWCGIIEKAEEVHCIDSSVIHLAQSIRKSGFFHNIRPSLFGSFYINPEWKIINYKNI